MNRIWTPLLGLLAVCFVVMGVACGSDDTTPEIGEGPADNVQGVWEGAYTTDDASATGTFCLNFEQDGRQITGNIAFDGGQPAAFSGLIAESRISFVWGPPASATPHAATSISSGGTFSGDVSAGTVSGTYTVSSNAARGTWTGHLSNKRSCSDAQAT